jgi:hypothetical protein
MGEESVVAGMGRLGQGRSLDQDWKDCELGVKVVRGWSGPGGNGAKRFRGDTAARGWIGR